MNHVNKLFTLAAVAVLGAVAGAWADQTNLVQDLNIQLTGIKQGQTSTNRNQVITSVDFARVSTRQVIDALGVATGNTFPGNARLVAITPLAGGNSTVAVRSGSNSVDVSTFFLHAQQSGYLNSSQLNLRSGRGSSSSYSVQRFALTDSSVVGPIGLHFDVSGMAVDTTDSSAPGSEISAQVSGAGERGGALLLLEGSIRVHGHTLEVVSDPVILNF